MDLRPGSTEFVVTGRANGAAPSLDASLIITDVVNSLRVALDNLTWGLSVAHSGKSDPPPPDPIPFASPWRKVRFPVVIDSARWESSSKKSLRFVDPHVRAVFKAAQPFERRKHDPERDEIAVLEELWNIDKHRHLTVAEFWVGLDRIESTMENFYGGLPVVGPTGEKEEFAPGHFDGHTFQVISQREPGPFIDGAELGRAVEVGSIRTLGPQVHMDAVLTRDVAFEEGPPAYGGRVIETLERIEGVVRNVVESFRPFA